ncbi:unnamed protein product [Effrenium voratum]|uniref:Uncharacterized protein n=1 Tax=Effrenium voratum TaxID=2562239 RepID=A0AA36IWS4_9DINO|nr:unnamed protein product [Effrenium voratum]
MEKRSRFAPKSELERLERIDPEVDEANAVLVESFLNVKRSLGAEVGEATGQPRQSRCLVCTFASFKDRTVSLSAKQGQQ